MRIGMNFAWQLKNSGIKVGFNGLGATASVNHLHFQVWQPNRKNGEEKRNGEMGKKNGRGDIERTKVKTIPQIL